MSLPTATAYEKRFKYENKDANPLFDPIRIGSQVLGGVGTVAFDVGETRMNITGLHQGLNSKMRRVSERTPAAMQMTSLSCDLSLILLTITRCIVPVRRWAESRNDWIHAGINHHAL